MRYIAIVAVLLVFSGCLSPQGAGATPTEIKKPELPDSLTEDRSESYAMEKERQLQFEATFAKIGRERIQDIGVSYRSNYAFRNQSGYLVHLEYTLYYRANGNDADVKRTANYWMNDTVVMRAATDGWKEPGPNPRNGDIIYRDDSTESTG